MTQEKKALRGKSYVNIEVHNTYFVTNSIVISNTKVSELEQRFPLGMAPMGGSKLCWTRPSSRDSECTDGNASRGRLGYGLSGLQAPVSNQAWIIHTP